VTLCAYVILFQTVFMLQGLKRPMFGLWIGLYRQVAAPLVVYHWLAFGIGAGLWGLWWGISLVTWSAALFTLWFGMKALGKAASLPSAARP
jgi:Na+-driven multidrug efflux pump